MFKGQQENTFYPNTRKAQMKNEQVMQLLRTQTAIAMTTTGAAVSVLYRDDEFVTYEDAAVVMQGYRPNAYTPVKNEVVACLGDFEEMDRGVVLAHDGNFDLVLHGDLIMCEAVNPECQTTTWGGGVKELARRVGYNDRIIDQLTDAGRAVLSGLVTPVYWAEGKLIRCRAFMPEHNIDLR
jgi:hypothetical protein